MKNTFNYVKSFDKYLVVLACFFIVALSSGCNSDVKQYKWRLQSQATATSVDYIELKKMTDNIRIMSNGQLTITPYPGGAITGGPDIFNAVKRKEIEMGSGWPNWWSGQNPAWAVMNAGPFDFMNIDASLIFFLAGPGTEFANKLSEPEGVIWRAAWWPGMEFGLLSTKPILGIDDLKDMKVRIGPGLPSEVLAATTGAFAIPLVPEEIEPALASGDLDAVEWTTTSGAWNLGLSSLTSHAIVPAIWQPSVLADFLINKEAYNELPPHLQAILETAIKSYTLTTTAIAKKQDFEALELFKNNGTTITRWSEDDIKVWKEQSTKILKEYSDRDELTKELIHAKQDFKKKYDHYYKLFGAYDKK